MPHTGEILQRIARAPVETLALGASPAVVAIGSSGLLSITGGTLSLIEYGRAGAYISILTTGGVLPVYAGDTVRITYLAAPTVTLIPA